MNDWKKELVNFGKENKDIEFKARIKFDNQFFYVLDNFEYDNIKYYYIIEDKIDEIEEAGGIENYQGKIRMEYIYEVEPEIYETVIDMELLKELDIVESARVISGEI